jgi:tyrosinase
MRRYKTPEPFAVPLWDGQPAFKRADLVFDGVEHGGDSFVGRIFLAADADESTPTTIDQAYAGSLYVFGHGRCFGDPGHCKVPSGPIHPFDYRRPHMLTPQVHVVQITDALRALEVSEFAVTVIPTTATGQAAGDVLSLTGISLVTYD